MGAMASQITSLSIVYSTVYSGADHRKHQGSASLAFVRGIHRSPVNAPHKWSVKLKMFSFDDAIMVWINRRVNTQDADFVVTLNVGGLASKNTRPPADTVPTQTIACYSAFVCNC